MATADRVGKNDELFDQWLDMDGYKRSTVFTRSTDKFGHSITKHCKVAPEVDARMEALVASKSNPAYRTTHDVMRNGLVHVLHYEAERQNDPETIAWVNHLAAVADMDRMAAQNMEWKSTIEHTRDTLTEMKADGDPASIQNVLGRMNPSLLIMPEPYRSRLAEVLDAHRSAFDIY